jgi:hypothetical protein
MLRDRVIAAWAKRIASEDSTKRKPASANRTVTFERFDRIHGAAWIIAARGRQERRKRHLIAADKEHEQRSHM